MSVVTLLPAGAVNGESRQLPKLPRSWPTKFQLGLTDQPGGAQALRNTTKFGFRYQYLAGGVNTGDGWATWNPDGQYVTYYIQESIDANITPVFSYYTIQHSDPGGTDEADTLRVNLNNADTMSDVYENLELFFKRAGAPAFEDEMVVLQVEPDLWGFAQKDSEGNDATMVPVKVKATGINRLQGLPNNLSGFARAVIKLRNAFAPNVVLGYHISVWGTDVDISLSDPPMDEVERLGRKAANWYRSLDANFDIAFAEFDDRDSGFNEHVLNDGGASWWDTGDFKRNVRFLSTFVRRARERVVMWQIPLGNTIMRAMDNTDGHYQDNRPQWFLGTNGREHLRRYMNAGVVAFLFGGGAENTTCACDEMGDGITNPAPNNGNDRSSYNADDDGGYFRHEAKAYYKDGALELP